MKKHCAVYHLYLVSFVCLLFISCSSPKVSYNEIKVAAPFPMEPIKECIFPEKITPLRITVPSKEGNILIRKLSVKPSRLVIKPAEGVWLFLPVNG